MTKQILTILGILIFFMSCKQTESKKIEESETKETVELETTELTSILEPYLEDDSLVSVLKSNLEKNTFDLKFKISKKSIKNQHVDNLIDTIITRTFKNTKLTSYRTKNKEWIYKAKIADSDFQLNDFIKVGIKKYVIEKSIPKRIKYDSLIISNLEQTSEFKLLFELGTLKSIEYNGYLD